MEYLITISTILIYASIQTIIFNKKITQTIPISLVEIVLIVYLAGLFDNLKIGMIIVKIIALIQLFVLICIICSKKNTEEVKEILKRIIIPEIGIYILLCAMAVFINKNRIFSDYDEFNHWARIIKYMYENNSFGTNPNSLIMFNEYPPFTAVFQYMFLFMKNAYSEETIITAQNILYISIVIPFITNTIKKRDIKKCIFSVITIVFLPMVFLENFYLDILVDGLLGIVFALAVYYSFEKEENDVFKYLKIFSSLIILCLTKTSGLALAVLAFIIILINLLKTKDKRNLIKLLIVTFLVISFTSVWYIKADNATKRWDFNQYIKTDNKQEKDMIDIAKKFCIDFFKKQTITDKELTVFTTSLVFICFNFYVMKVQKRKDFKKYSVAMLISFLIYMFFLLLTYVTIYDTEEAIPLYSFERYCATIFLAISFFDFFVVFEAKENIKFKEIFILIVLLLCFLPQENIEEKYINSKEYIEKSISKRSVTTQLKNYTSILNEEDRILYIAEIEDVYLGSLNQYEIMPIKIEKIMQGNFSTEQELKDELINGNYTHIYIYRMTDENKENIENIFLDKVKNDTLYEILKNEDQIVLQKVKNL